MISFIEAVEKHGSMKKAAAALGIPETTFRRRLAQARQDFASARADDGFVVKATSTLTDLRTGETMLQWVKASADEEKQKAALLKSMDALAAKLPQVGPAKSPTGFLPALMAVYPIGDAHIGMRSWAPETGQDWDMAIAERVQCGAMSALVDLAPAAERAVIINLGDWFHSDNMEGVTSRHRHHLDMDGRYGKMIEVGVKVMRQCIESALRKHKTVRVVNVIGNHDDTGALWLSIALQHIYANEPRLEIESKPAPFMYFEHGKVLVGCHHGHTCKPNDLPGVMAADRAEAWGRSKHRYWYLGHVHHQSVKEYAGVTVESFNTLAARDAYAAWGGYRSAQNMKCIVLHSEYGEVCRHTVSPEMLKSPE